MSEVNSTSMNYVTLSQASKAAKKVDSQSDFGADAFMQLLLTQLKNQNPLEPLKENEMIVQMAQLNSVQELRKMSSSLDDVQHVNQILSGSGLIGKMVSYLGPDGLLYSAIAKSVSVSENDVVINTDYFSLPLSKITEIWEDDSNG